MSEHPFDVVPHTPPLSISSASTELNRTGAWKYMQPVYHDRVAPCSAGCPAGVDIAGYLTMLRDYRLAEASDLLLRENPMPAVTGRVCNHPCEDKCSRSTFDGAVSIHAIERMLGDRILGSPLPKPEPVSHAERIAVIGSGPAGLACAYHLTRLGYVTEVFEQEQQAGGMLRLGIPEYRLPRDVLDEQLKRYQAMGIVIRTGVRAGEDIPWSTLTNEFAAVFIASGAHVSKLLQLEHGADGAMLPGLDFLRAVNGGKRPNVGRRVIVIGGGNTAMDCARTAKRLGAETTLVVYRRTRNEMPAIEEEIREAEREGVEFVFLAVPARLELGGKQLELVCQRMQLDAPDAQGRRSLVPLDGPPLTLPADTVITAIGEDAALDALPDGLREAGIVTDAWGTSRLANIFLGGDLAGGLRTVVGALGDGKRAAIGIDRYLSAYRGDLHAEPSANALRLGGDGALSMARWTDTDPVKRVSPLNSVVAPEEINTSYFAPAPRHDDHYGGQAHRFAETNAGLSLPEALSEAARCFQCGVCNECELCRIYCSDAAIQLDASGGRFTIDLDHCKGCGVCAVECPRGAISMERLGAQL